MKRHVILGIAVLLFTGAAAVAADQTSNWTGYYLGANGGYGWNGIEAGQTPGDPNTANVFLGLVNVAPSSASFDMAGGFGGIQAGYNWQFGRKWVTGIEADFDWSNIDGSGTGPATIAFAATPANFNASQKVEWFGTLRARLGYLPADNVLLYATAGLAYGQVEGSASVVLPPGLSNSTGNFGFSYACGGIYGGPTCFSGSHTRSSAGWTVGAGAEYAFARSFALKIEYLYVNLGSDGLAIPAAIFTAGGSPSALNVNFGDAAFNLVRAGLNYRF